MPQVPYTGAPDVQPEQRSYSAAPQLNIRVDPNAFGANIGAAVQHLGGTMDKVSDELWQRAVAMQQLKNETEANDHINDAAQQIGDRTAKYEALEGKNAVQGFSQYQQDLNGIRTSTLANISNPDVARRFDNEIRSTIVRSNIYGARHSATENKKWIDNSLADTNDRLVDELTKRWDDVPFRTQALQQLRDNAAKQGDIRGWDDAEIQNQADRAASKGIAAVIHGQNSSGDSIGAKATLDANRGNLHYNDLDRLQPQVEHGYRTVITRNAATNVSQGYAPYLSPSERTMLQSVQSPLQQLVKKAQQDNPDLEIRISSGARTQAQQQAAWDRYQSGQGGIAARPGQSNHQWGGAIDLRPGQGTTYKQIQDAMYKANQDLGGSFLSDEHARLGPRDMGHYSINKGIDPSSVPKLGDLPVTAKQTWARKYVEAQLPQDEFAGDMAETRVASADARANHVALVQRQNDQDLLQGRIMNIAPQGEPVHAPTTQEELLASPEAQAAWERLGQAPDGPAKQMSIIKGMESWQKSVVQASDQNLLTRLDGIRRDSPSDYLKINPYDESLQLSQPDRRKIIDAQAQLKKAQPDADPVLRRALQSPVLQSLMSDPEINISKKDDPNKYYQFVGALGQQMDAEMKAQGGKPLKIEEINKIGRQLLSGPRAAPTWFQRITTGKGTVMSPVTAYDRMSSEDKEGLRQELQQKTPYEIVTDRDVAVEATHRAFNDLFSKDTQAKKVMGGQ